MKTTNQNKLQSRLRVLAEPGTLAVIALSCFMGASITAAGRAAFDLYAPGGKVTKQDGILSYEIEGADKSGSMQYEYKGTVSMSEFKHKAAYPVAAAGTLAGLGLAVAAYRRRQTQSPAP